MATKKTKDVFSDEEWHTIATQAVKFQQSLLWAAIQMRLNERKDLALKTLLESKDEKDLFYAQGVVNSYNRAIMVLEDIREIAGKKISVEDPFRHA